MAIAMPRAVPDDAVSCAVMAATAANAQPPAAVDRPNSSEDPAGRPLVTRAGTDSRPSSRLAASTTVSAAASGA
ncbi:hypothetical protein GCM10020220_083590 [Nonomuraea rubra]